jgi:hypothetical protein
MASRTQHREPDSDLESSSRLADGLRSAAEGVDRAANEFVNELDQADDVYDLAQSYVVASVKAQARVLDSFAEALDRATRRRRSRSPGARVPLSQEQMDQLADLVAERLAKKPT